jgi:CYTH domain-containing protein
MSLGVCFIELVVTVLVIVTYIEGDNDSCGDGDWQWKGDGVGGDESYSTKYIVNHSLPEWNNK